MMRRLRRWLAGLITLLLLVSVLAVGVLRWVNPPITAFMAADWLDDVLHGRPSTLSRQWVSLDAISPSLQLAVIAAEDQKFPVHWGFDVSAIQGAMESNARGGGVRGASTLTQQVAKNLFLWSGRSYVRKALEAYFTLLMELLWPKARILEVYLNIAEWDENLYGAEAAARRFYGVSARRLSSHQASHMAAVLPNPKRYNPVRPSSYVAERAHWIRGQMRNLGVSYLPN